ncbi:MAG TPA: RDD family protein [Caulobacteraceae bacterium]
MTAETTIPSARAKTLARQFITPEGVDLQLTLGSAAARASALIIDLVIMAISLLIITIVALILAVSAGLKSAEPWAIIWLLGFFVLRNGYFIAFELAPRAATLGKRILGLRVVARDGGRLTGESVFVRNAMREIEVFLPLTFLLASSAAGDPVQGWQTLLGLVWTGGFLMFPLFNRDRLRVGDLVAGTWVVETPRRAMTIDLAANSGQASGFEFSREQVAAYGVKELQVLEGVLRARDQRTMAAVAQRIRGKIGWFRLNDQTDLAFLIAYYVALRGRLEHRLLFGHRRRDKFDKA